MNRVVVLLIGLASAGFTRETIDIDGFHCGAVTPNEIVCRDIGSTCRAVNHAKQMRHERDFGCVDPQSKNYPCLPDEGLDATQQRWRDMLEMQCEATIHRTLKCSADLQHCE